MSIATVARMPNNTARSVYLEIEGAAIERLSQCSTSNALVARQLGNLRREWDLERALETWFASVVLTGVTLAATRNRRWMAFPAIAAGFMLQHAIQGWCPQVPLLRRLGFRTQPEIARERYALKGMRGDFAGLGLDRGPGCAQRAFDAARPR
jgi:hypothetical protein